MDAFWIALALVLVIEGIGPLLFPNRWQRLLRHISELPSQELRQAGAVLVTVGVLCVFLLTA